MIEIVIQNILFINDKFSEIENKHSPNITSDKNFGSLNLIFNIC